MAYGNTTKREPDVGIGYKATFKDKQGQEQGYLKLSLRASELEALPVNDAGFIALTVFTMNVAPEKRKENTPDVVVKKSITKKAPATEGAASATTGNIPF